MGTAQRQNAENKKYEVIVYVSDPDGNAVSGIVISVKGKGSPSNPTDGSGRTMLILQGEVLPGDELDLVLLVDVRENEGWEVIPHYRPLIHAFNNKPNTHTTLVLRQNKATRQSSLNSIATPAGEVDYQSLETELVNAYIQLGHYEYIQKRYPEAFAAYMKALLIRPDHDELLFYVALSLVQQRKYEEVLSYIEKCLKIRKGKPESSDLASSHEIYAMALRGLGRVTEAEREIDTAMAIRSRLPKQD